MKTHIAQPLESVFYEGDPIKHIYFVKQGKCAYILPKYSNQAFISIIERSCFGVIDIIAGCFNENDDEYALDLSINSSEEDKEMEKLEYWADKNLKRSFTVKCSEFETAELITLSKSHFCRMKSEFSESYHEFFKGAIDELQKTISVKLHVMKHCNRVYE